MLSGKYFFIINIIINITTKALPYTIRKLKHKLVTDTLEGRENVTNISEGVNLLQVTVR